MIYSLVWGRYEVFFRINMLKFEVKVALNVFLEYAKPSLKSSVTNCQQLNENTVKSHIQNTDGNIQLHRQISVDENVLVKLRYQLNEK